jgi:hypothetical protein
VILLFLTLSCSDGGLPAAETIDPQLRALNAKCPPKELCGPQDSPETLVLAWLNASENGLCTVLAKYTSPDRSDIVSDYCGSTASYIFDTIVVKETLGRTGGRPNLKEVRMDGKLRFKLHGQIFTKDSWIILVEEIGGYWYVFDGYSFEIPS